ncbi:MAG: hypothetical protein ACK56F_04470, partial [bacterium]
MTTTSASNPPLATTPGASGRNGSAAASHGEPHRSARNRSSVAKNTGVRKMPNSVTPSMPLNTA